MADAHKVDITPNTSAASIGSNCVQRAEISKPQHEIFVSKHSIKPTQIASVSSSHRSIGAKFDASPDTPFDHTEDAAIDGTNNPGAVSDDESEYVDSGNLPPLPLHASASIKKHIATGKRKGEISHQRLATDTEQLNENKLKPKYLNRSLSNLRSVKKTVPLQGDADSSSESSDEPLPQNKSKSMLSLNMMEPAASSKSLNKSLPTLKRGTSLKSKSSSVEDEGGLLGYLVKLFYKWIDDLLQSEVYKIYRKIVDSVRNQILFVALVQSVLYTSVFCILFFLINVELSSISLYNLIHAILSFQGKILLFVGWVLVHLIQKGFCATELVTSTHGVPIAQIADLRTRKKSQINMLYIFSLILVEGMLWVLIYYMVWSPIEADLGYFPCTIPTYNGAWNIMSSFPYYLGGNTEFGALGVYGLPLTSGLIGGTTASPGAAPNSNFLLEGTGCVYIISTVCTDPVIVNSTVSQGTTSISLFDSEYWGEIYNVAMLVTYPAGSHEWQDFSEFDIQQKCEVNVVTGVGTITTAFTSDEWHSITDTTAKKIVIGTEDTLVTVTSNMEAQVDFATARNALMSTEQTFENVTGWIAHGIELALESDNVLSLWQRGVTASVLCWAVGADGLYNPNATWKGISSAVAQVCHYVLQQSDQTQVSVCNYKGISGPGILTAPQWLTTGLIVILIISACLEVSVVSSYLLLVAASDGLDRAAQIITHPLRMLYYMRASASRLITIIDKSDLGYISLLHHFADLRVRFGEDKSTRGEPIGTLTLDTPKSVVKMSVGREFV